jgi:hypothetical protein
MELANPSVVSAPPSLLSSCVASLLSGGEYTHWTSEDENPIDCNFVFDLGDRHAPARIEWSDWGREDGAAYMKLCVSDELHGSWSRIDGWAARQTSDWQFHDIATENRCLGRFWKIVIRRAHRPGFGLQLRGLRLYVCSKAVRSKDQHMQSSHRRMDMPLSHVRTSVPPKKPSSVCATLDTTHSAGTEWNWIELVKELRAENAQLNTKLQLLQGSVAEMDANLLEKDVQIGALKEQLQQGAKRLIQEQAQSKREVWDLQQKLMNLTGETSTHECQRMQEARDEAIRSREHVEHVLSQLLSTSGWYVAPVGTAGSNGKFTPQYSPLPSTQASTQVSPEPSPSSSPRLAEVSFAIGRF